MTEDEGDTRINWPMVVMFVPTMMVVLFAAWRAGML